MRFIFVFGCVFSCLEMSLNALKVLSKCCQIFAEVKVIYFEFRIIYFAGEVELIILPEGLELIIFFKF